MGGSRYAAKFTKESCLKLANLLKVSICDMEHAEN